MVKFDLGTFALRKFQRDSCLSKKNKFFYFLHKWIVKVIKKKHVQNKISIMKQNDSTILFSRCESLLIESRAIPILIYV